MWWRVVAAPDGEAVEVKKMANELLSDADNVINDIIKSSGGEVCFQSLRWMTPKRSNK